MSLAWDDFIADDRPGNVAGIFYYFDTEAQNIIIRNTDDALVSTYDTVEMGQWLDSVWANNLRIGNFGLSQFVPRHVYNGEIWAVGIVPTTIPETTGRFPTPEVPSGFYLFRYKYYQDLTKILDSFDTSEQSENQIKDAGFTIKNIGESEINKTSSLFATGARVICKLGMGDSGKMFLGTVFLDEIAWDKSAESMTLSGRNAIGYYLSEQTFDDTRTFTGTRSSVVNDILIYSGVNMAKVYIEEDATVSNPTFEPTDSLLTGLNRIFDVWGWQMQELPNGSLIIGSKAHQEIYTTTEVHEVSHDEAFTRNINQRADGAYSRLALQSSIPEDAGPPIVPAFTRTVYKDIPYFDGWNIGNRRTLYITVLENQSQSKMEEMADEYAKAYQYIGVNVSREIPIHPEIASGDVIDILDANTEEYIQKGIVTQVTHKVDVKNGSAKTVVSIDSGGTIEIGAEVSTYTASDVTGDTRRRELIDVIRKASKK